MGGKAMNDKKWDDLILIASKQPPKGMYQMELEGKAKGNKPAAESDVTKKPGVILGKQKKPIPRDRSKDKSTAPKNPATVTTIRHPSKTRKDVSQAKKTTAAKSTVSKADHNKSRQVSSVKPNKSLPAKPVKGPGKHGPLVSTGSIAPSAVPRRTEKGKPPKEPPKELQEEAPVQTAEDLINVIGSKAAHGKQETEQEQEKIANKGVFNSHGDEHHSFLEKDEEHLLGAEKQMVEKNDEKPMEDATPAPVAEVKEHGLLVRRTGETTEEREKQKEKLENKEENELKEVQEAEIEDHGNLERRISIGQKSDSGIIEDGDERSSQHDESRMGPEICWACKMSKETTNTATDEWTLLEEELNAKPHYYVHTCGRDNKRLLKEMQLTQYELNILMSGQMENQTVQRVQQRPAEDYREQDEWAILEHEIHDDKFIPHHHNDDDEEITAAEDEATLEAVIEMAKHKSQTISPIQTHDEHRKTVHPATSAHRDSGSKRSSVMSVQEQQVISNLMMEEDIENMSLVGDPPESLSEQEDAEDNNNLKGKKKKKKKSFNHAAPKLGSIKDSGSDGEREVDLDATADQVNLDSM